MKHQNGFRQSIAVTALLALGAGSAFADGPFSTIAEMFPGSTFVTTKTLFPSKYVYEGNPSGPYVCWVRGSSPTVRLKLNYTGPAAMWTVTGAGTLITPTGPYPISVTPTGLGTPAGPANVYLNVVIGGLPNAVTRGDLYIYLNLGTGGPLHLEQDILVDAQAYLVEATPVKTMANRVWVEVLNDTCSWAMLKAGTTNVLDALTSGLFWGSVGFYDPSNPRYIDRASEEFHLKRFLDERPLATPDCQDVAAYLEIAFNAQGGTTTLTSSGYINAQNAWVPFRTNPVCGIGWNALELPTYSVHDFNFHAQNNYSGVWDSCAAQWETPLGYPYASPIRGWALIDYWQSYHGGTFRGLVNNWQGLNGPQFLPFPPDRLTWKVESVTSVN